MSPFHAEVESEFTKFGSEQFVELSGMTRVERLGIDCVDGKVIIQQWVVGE